MGYPCPHGETREPHRLSTLRSLSWIPLFQHQFKIKFLVREVPQKEKGIFSYSTFIISQPQAKQARKMITCTDAPA
jgi:hypothetical protein